MSAVLSSRTFKVLALVMALACLFVFVGMRPAYADASDTAQQMSQEEQATSTKESSNVEGSAPHAISGVDVGAIEEQQVNEDAPISTSEDEPPAVDVPTDDPTPADTEAPTSKTPEEPNEPSVVNGDSEESSEPAQDESSEPAQDVPDTNGMQGDEPEGAVVDTDAASTASTVPETSSAEKPVSSAGTEPKAEQAAAAVRAEQGVVASAQVSARTVPVNAAARTQGARIQTTAKTQSTQPKKGKGDLAEGKYYFASKLASGMVVDVAGASKNNKANVQLYGVNATKAQQWELLIAADGYAVIKNRASGKVLAVAGGVAKNCQNVLQDQRNNSLAQKWLPIKYKGWYLFKSALAGNFVLDVAEAKAQNGANLQIYKRNNTKAQLFRAYGITLRKASAGKRVAKNGVYTLRPYISDTRVIEIAGSSKKASGNARLAKNKATNNSELFRIAWDGAGFYTITNVNSGLKLSPSRACSVPGVNVAQYKLGSVDLAKWKIVKHKQGGYSFINKATGLALDVNGAKDAERQNVQVHSANNSKAQTYALRPASSVRAGIYQFVPMVNMTLRMQLNSSSAKAGTGFQNKTAALNASQSFRIAKVAGGYTIQPLVSGLYLTADSKGALSQQKARSKHAGQIWTAQSAGGNLVFVNKSTAKALDVRAASNKAGAALQVYRKNATKAQQFLLRNTDAIYNGVYHIALAGDTGKVLSIKDGRRTNGANVRVLGKNGYNAQRFTVSQVAPGVYTFRSVETGRAVEVASGSKSAGANVQMYKYNGTNAQKWKLRINNDCSFTFVNANSGKVLDVAGGKLEDGANIQVYNSNGTKAQRFRMHGTSVDRNERVRLYVPCYNQNPELPTGCESVALTNALRYWGFNLNKTTIANRMPWGDDGVYDFIGNPYDYSGWIICAPGITNTANSYLKSKGSSIRARNITGTSLYDLRKHLDQGNPVVVWTTISMGEPGYASYKHGYPLRSNNHAVVLTGYNPQTGNYEVADSLDGTVWRDGKPFERLYKAMGKQAVVLEG